MPSRHLSRRRALQLLYECDLRQIAPQDAIRDFYHTLYTEENDSLPAHDPFMEQLLFGVHGEQELLDALITRRSDHWKLERMALVDRNVLRLAIYEMLRTSTPPAVIIDEALELARRFSSDESVRFVNGLLDALRKGDEIANRPHASE